MFQVGLWATHLVRVDIASYDHASGSTANMEIEGTAAGTGYDQIAVTGTVTISGATLSLTVTDIPSAGATYVLIDNDGSDAVIGTFSGLAEGASITAGGATYTISYAGGTGNDVVLTLSGPPVEASGDGVMSGSEGDDRLVGGSTADHIRVFGGNDTVTATNTNTSLIIIISHNNTAHHNHDTSRNYNA